MGTHPIFESDFDCLTETKMEESILALLDDDNLEMFEREHLPPVETEEERTTRQNVARIVQLRPGSKRKRNTKVTREVVASINETKLKYKKLRVEIEANIDHEDEDHLLAKVMPYLINYLTIEELGKLAQVNRALAAAIYYNDYEWRRRMRSAQLMPLPSKFKVNRGYEQYKLAMAWSSRNKSHLAKIGKDAKEATFGQLKIVHDQGDTYYTANGKIMKDSEAHVAFDEQSKTKINAFTVKHGRTLVGTTTGTLFVMSMKNKFSVKMNMGPIKDICANRKSALVIGQHETSLCQVGHSELKGIERLDLAGDGGCMSGSFFCVNGRYCGTVLGKDDKVVHEWPAPQPVKCALVDQLLYRPREGLVRQVDTRVGWSAQATFDCGAVTAVFTDNSHFTQLTNNVTSCFADDVKLLAGKTNGDVLCFDLRHATHPVRIWGSHGKLNLTTKRTMMSSYPKLAVESLSVSLNHIYGMSRLYAFAINLV